MSDYRFLFVGNGPYSNRGCEAIVRGTVKILRSTFENPTFVNVSFGASNSPRVPVDDTDPGIVHQPLRRVVKWTPRWMAVKATNRLCPSVARYLQFAGIEKAVRGCRAALSIGGDNYTLDYGIPRLFLQMDEYLVRHGIPIVIWGASVGPFESKPEFAKIMLSHFKQDVSAIFVREPRSLDYLAHCGVGDKVYLMPDPAFVMDPVPVENNRIGVDIEKTMAIGLNVSPLMARYVSSGDISRLRAMTVGIIDALRGKFSMPVILVPHVTSPHSNDSAFLESVAHSLGDKREVFCLPNNLSAAETKWVISKLHCLIAARTHATIASLSSFVPTVSLAYSRKAYGLNEMLFGHADYVVSPEELTPDIVVEKVDWVLRQDTVIRGNLREYMKNVWQLAREAGLVLKQLVESGSK